MTKKDTKQKKGYKIRLDLTKRRYLMLSEANKLEGFIAQELLGFFIYQLNFCIIIWSYLW